MSALLLHLMSLVGAKQGNLIVAETLANYASTLTENGKLALLIAVQSTLNPCTTSNTSPAQSPASQTIPLVTDILT